MRRTELTGQLEAPGERPKNVRLIVDERVQSTIQTAASAAALTLPLEDVVTISGTTSITSIAAGGHAGKVRTLIFEGVLTVTDGSNLNLAGNFVTTADDTITLACDGTDWFEVARSVN